MKGEIRGEFEKCQIEHPKRYFVDRGTYLDCRGGIVFPKSSNVGQGVKIITYSHYISEGEFGKVVSRPVIVGENVWIASYAILYNCTIGDGAVISLGTVVRSRTVPAWTIVEGNPPYVIGHFDHVLEKWYTHQPYQIMEDY